MMLAGADAGENFDRIVEGIIYQKIGLMKPYLSLFLLPKSMTPLHTSVRQQSLRYHVDLVHASSVVRQPIYIFHSVSQKSNSGSSIPLLSRPPWIDWPLEQSQCNQNLDKHIRPNSLSFTYICSIQIQTIYRGYHNKFVLSAFLFICIIISSELSVNIHEHKRQYFHTPTNSVKWVWNRVDIRHSMCVVCQCLCTTVVLFMPSECPIIHITLCQSRTCRTSANQLTRCSMLVLCTMCVIVCVHHCCLCRQRKHCCHARLTIPTNKYIYTRSVH